MTNDRKQFNEKYYGTMLGAVVESVDGGAEFPFFTIRTPDGRMFKLEVSADEEGNGPGFLFGLPIPEKSLRNKRDIEEVVNG